MAKTQEEKEAGLLEAIKKMTVADLDKFKAEGFSPAVQAAIAQRRSDLNAENEGEDGDLLIMVKAGHEKIKVHPTQVGPWEKQGWSLEE